MASVPDIHQALELHQAGQLGQALEMYRQILLADPNQPDALHLLGVLLRDSGKLAPAIELLSHAVRLNPYIAAFHINLAEAFRRSARLDEALAEADQGVAVDCNRADAHATRAAVLQSQGRLDEALVSYDRAIDLDPNLVDARYNRAWIWLARGDYERGWEEYEWRWKRRDFHLTPRVQPRWDGTPLAGRALLVECEQGLGDTLQFVRYVRLLQTQGNNVLLLAQPQLVPLLRASGVKNVFLPDAPLPPFDVYAPLLSLPHVLKTTLDNVPADVPYLSAPADLAAHWQVRLRKIGGFTIGIHWQGNPGSPHEPRRSMRLSNFERLAPEGVSLVSVQKGFGVEQIAESAQRVRLIDFSDELDEANGPFMDTAAIMTSLDLVVTSDTVTAHLAGALGVRVWVPLAFESDWRWLLGREDSPWYPTMRLFRQSQPGDWPGVFTRMASELARLLPARGS